MSCGDPWSFDKALKYESAKVINDNFWDLLMTTKNEWIKWKDRAPSEADLPIECAVFGDSVPTCWIEIIPIGHRNYNIWRPYICDIPKAEAVKNLLPLGCHRDGEYTEVNLGMCSIPFRIYHDGKSIEWNGEKYMKAEEVKIPTPDANGWRRIEDRKPERELEIKFERKGDAHTYIGIVDRFTTDRVEAIGLKGLVPFDDIEKWCPLDMTGPEEK